MKNVLYALFIISAFSACEKGEVIPNTFYQCSLLEEDTSVNIPNHQLYTDLLDSMVSQGVVGVMMSVYHPQNGYWHGASGKADLYNDIDMEPCQITRVGSTVKMVTAAVVLQLAEEERLDLDDAISSYLTEQTIDNIENAEVATIRQLLQHTSGIYNYIQNLEFQTASLNELIREWQAADLLQYAKGKSAYFEPGTEVRYSNTGYILLGLLIEKIEAKPLHQVFTDRVFEPLGMSFTSFASKDPVPDGIVRGYIDLYSNYQVVESTYYSGWDYHTADGGLISNPHDLVIFFKALVSGQLIKEESLNQMLIWQSLIDQTEDFFNIAYGLGIFKIETDSGTAYMHSGDAIGYYANMIFFPEDGTCLSYAVNSNYGKIDEIISSKKAMDRIFEIVR